MVFLVHVHVLSGAQELVFLSRYISSDLAVKGFFVVSGFLIFRSFEASASVRDYFENRVRRIYPAYACVIIVCAVAGGFITQLRWSDYFSPALAKYLAANLVFLNFLAQELPGVFTGNPLQAVNGALWTLKIEVAFYCVVPFIALLFRRYGTVAASMVLYVMSVIYLTGFEAMAEHTGRPYFAMLARQLPGQLTYFIVGGLFHYHELVMRHRALPIFLVSLTLLLFRVPLIDPILTPVCLGFVVMYFAMGIPFLGNFGRHGDFSYAIYIFHYPVLQFLVWKGLFAWNVTFAFILAIAVVLFLAWVSWHLVERRWLRKSSHYVLSTADATQSAEGAGTR